MKVIDRMKSASEELSAICGICDTCDECLLQDEKGCIKYRLEKAIRKYDSRFRCDDCEFPIDCNEICPHDDECCVDIKHKILWKCDEKGIDPKIAELLSDMAVVLKGEI